MTIPLFFQDLQERFTALHNEIDKQLTDLPDAALDWSPGDGMNSIAILIAHTIGAERYWVGDVASADPSHRVRDTEFETTGTTVAELRERLRQCDAYTHVALAKLKLDDLGRSQSLPSLDRTFTVGWSLLHALEHTAQHMGHIQQLRQLWEQRKEPSLH